jgi:hypothetical protein
MNSPKSFAAELSATILNDTPAAITAIDKKLIANKRKSAASAKRVQADVARQLTATQTKVMAKSLDVPEEDVADHVQDVTPTGYQGPMKVLRERVKAGAYTKAANGQPSCNDEVAQILGHLEPTEVIKACIIAMDLATNPYLTLNIGQQSMNLRNKLRGAIKRGEFGMGVLREAVEVVMEGRAPKIDEPIHIKLTSATGIDTPHQEGMETQSVVKKTRKVKK